MKLEVCKLMIPTDIYFVKEQAMHRTDFAPRRVLLSDWINPFQKNAVASTLFYMVLIYCSVM